MTELTEFLLARIAEDEATARCAAEDSFLGLRGRIGISDDPWPTELQFADRFTPARVLAESEAKRRIVERYAYLYEHGDSGNGEWVLAVSSLPYANHPDYRDEWRP